MEEETTKTTVSRFHSYHRDNIELYEDNTVAFRKLSYGHALIFSEKPLMPGEIFLVEIEKTENDLYNNMSIGLTQFDPHIAASMGKIPPYKIFPDLISVSDTWIFTVKNPRDIYNYGFCDDCKYCYIYNEDDNCDDSDDGFHNSIPKYFLGDKYVKTSRGTILRSVLRPSTSVTTHTIQPKDVGSRIGIVYLPGKCNSYSYFAKMYYIENGEDKGSSEEIPYKQGPLYVVIDVHGAIKQVRIIQLYGVMSLQSICRDAILQHVEKSEVPSLPLPKTLKEYLLYQSRS